MIFYMYTTQEYYAQQSDQNVNSGRRTGIGWGFEPPIVRLKSKATKIKKQAKRYTNEV